MIEGQGMTGLHDSERRRAERIRINAEFASMPLATYISDLSELGVFIHTPSLAPMGSTIQLRFTVLLDDPVIIEGQGRVVRHQQEPSRGMGIEFTELSRQMVGRVNEVVSRQRPRDSGPPLSKRAAAANNAAAATLARGEASRRVASVSSESAATLVRGEAARLTAGEVSEGSSARMARKLGLEVPAPPKGSSDDTDDAKTSHYPAVKDTVRDDSE